MIKTGHMFTFPGFQGFQATVGAAAMVRFPDGRKIPGWQRDDIQPLIMQSVEAQPRTPTLDGKPYPAGIIPYWAQDVPFVLDRLKAIDASDPNHILTGRLDLDRRHRAPLPAGRRPAHTRRPACGHA